MCIRDRPLLRSYANLQEEYKNSNGFGYRSQIKGVLKGLGFSEEDYGKPVSLLSGGQKTRIALGKILLQNFNLLLLDEPTANVDMAVETELFELLHVMSADITIVVVSHDLGFVSQYVESVICVNRRVMVHPTAAVTGEVISALYGADVRMVNHRHGLQTVK